MHVLAITPHDEDRAILARIFQQSHWDLQLARNIAEANMQLTTGETQVILCERTLPDGSWTDLMPVMPQDRGRPRVIVISRQADDELWTEVLNLGGYDLQQIPFREPELFRMLNLARSSWSEEEKRRKNAPHTSRTAAA